MTMGPKQPPPTGKHPQRRRKKGAPRPPRRPMSSYNIFFRLEREKMKQHTSGGGEIGTALTQIIAQKWRELADNDKLYYEGLALKDKKRYALELVKWKQSQEAEPTQSSLLSPAARISDLGDVSPATTEWRHHLASQSRIQSQYISDEFLFAEDQAGSYEQKPPSRDINSMVLPELPIDAIATPFQSRAGMSPENFSSFMTSLQSLQSLRAQALSRMAVFPQGKTPEANSLLESCKTFDYRLEINRVATELGRDGVDFFVRLFRDTHQG